MSVQTLDDVVANAVGVWAGNDPEYLGTDALTRLVCIAVREWVHSRAVNADWTFGDGWCYEGPAIPLDRFEEYE